jgi:hypothetical protein
LSGIAIGVPELWGRSPFPRKLTRYHENTPQTGRNPNTNKAHGPTASVASLNHHPQLLSSGPLSRLRVGRRTTKHPPHSRARHPLSRPPPRSWASAPRASLRLARGFHPSSGSPPRSRDPTPQVSLCLARDIPSTRGASPAPRPER